MTLWWHYDMILNAMLPYYAIPQLEDVRGYSKSPLNWTLQMSMCGGGIRIELIPSQVCAARPCGCWIVCACLTSFVHDGEDGSSSQTHALGVHQGGADEGSDGCVYCRAPLLQHIPAHNNNDNNTRNRGLQLGLCNLAELKRLQIWP